MEKMKNDRRSGHLGKTGKIVRVWGIAIILLDFSTENVFNSQPFLFLCCCCCLLFLLGSQ